MQFLSLSVTFCGPFQALPKNWRREASSDWQASLGATFYNKKSRQALSVKLIKNGRGRKWYLTENQGPGTKEMCSELITISLLII